MNETVNRNFKVRGTIHGLFTKEGGSTETVLIGNMQVELWHKGPMELFYLGAGPTDNAGQFTIEFSTPSPSPIITNGKISDVFVKVYYKNKLVTGDLNEPGGSFD